MRRLTVDRSEAAPLDEGEYYTFDIIGLHVFDLAGKELGIVENVLRTGSNDVYQARNEEGNLTCTLPGKVESINFDLKHTYYRTGVSDAGADHYNQINTVYFSIPKKYLQEFDRIYSITPEFWEYKTKYAMVTSDSDFKNNFLPYTKNDYSNMSDYPEYFLANKNLHTVANTATNGVDYYPEWSFAMKLAKSGTQEK